MTHSESIQNNALVSVVVPVYNAEKYIKECIESILNQSYKNIEIIVVNDGSTDDSLNILKQYSDKITIISKKNGGTASALNTGIDNMKGQWFKWTSADDILHHNAIEELLSHVKKNNADSDNKTIVYMSSQTIDQNGKKIQSIGGSFNYENLFIQNVCMLDHFFGSYSTNIIHKSIFDNIGKFDEKVGILEDYELNLKLALLHGYKFYYVPKCIFSTRVHEQQITIKQSSKIRKINDYRRESVLKQIDQNKKEKYLTSLKKYRNSKYFKYGIWICVNNSDLKITIPGSKKQALAYNMLNRYPFLRIVAISYINRNISYLRGWFWAKMNMHHEIIKTCRNKSLLDFTLEWTPQMEKGRHGVIFTENPT